MNIRWWMILSKSYGSTSWAAPPFCNSAFGRLTHSRVALLAPFPIQNQVVSIKTNQSLDYSDCDVLQPFVLTKQLSCAANVPFENETKWNNITFKSDTGSIALSAPKWIDSPFKWERSKRFENRRNGTVVVTNNQLTDDSCFVSKDYTVVIVNRFILIDSYRI